MTEITRTIYGLLPKSRYVVRVRALNQFGIASGWSEALDFTTTGDNSVPSSVLDLTADFARSTVIVRWLPPLLNTDGTQFTDFDKFVITVSSGAIVRSYETFTGEFLYTPEQNITDFGTIQVGVLFTVTVLDTSGNSSAPVSVSGVNLPPTIVPQTPELTPMFSLIGVEMFMTNILDFGAFSLEHATAVGGPWTVIYTGSNAYYTHEITENVAHFYRYRYTDFAGQLGPYSLTATTTIFNTTDEPEGLVTIASLNISGTGRIQSINYSATGTLAGYRLSSNRLTIQNGGIDILGLGAAGTYGGVTLDSNNLKAVYNGNIQFLANSAGVFIGGNNPASADIYVDTAANTTYIQGNTIFRSQSGIYTLDIDSTGLAGSNKFMRLYNTSGAESFYLTNEGQGFFNKGVIGGVIGSGGGANRLRNSSFESIAGVSSTGTGGLDYWNNYNNGAGTNTVTRVAGAVHGGFSASIVWAGSTGNKGIYQLAPVGGFGSTVWPTNSIWTFSCWIKSSAGTDAPILVFNAAGFATAVVSAPTSVTLGEWYRYVWKITVTGSPTSEIYLAWTSASGSRMVDAIQLERGEVATAFSPMPEEILPVVSGDNIQSSNYIPGSSGWSINGSGSAEFGNVTVRGNVTGSTITGSDFLTATTGERIVITSAQEVIDGYTANYVKFYSPRNNGADPYRPGRIFGDMTAGNTGQLYFRPPYADIGSGQTLMGLESDANGDTRSFLGGGDAGQPFMEMRGDLNPNQINIYDAGNMAVYGGLSASGTLKGNGGRAVPCSYGYSSQMAGNPAVTTGPYYIQSGTAVATTNGNSAASINFPVAFPNGCVAVIVSNGDGDVFTEKWFTTTTLTASYFDVRLGPFVVGQIFRVSWIAIGF